MLGNLVRDQVLIRKLGADEGARSIRGRDASCPPKSGQIQPLVIVARAILVTEKGRPSHVWRVLEDQEGLVSPFGAFKGPHLQCALAPVTFGIEKSHREQDHLVPVAAVDSALLLHDREAAILRRQRSGHHRGPKEKAGEHDESRGDASRRLTCRRPPGRSHGTSDGLAEGRVPTRIDLPAGVSSRPQHVPPRTSARVVPNSSTKRAGRQPIRATVRSLAGPGDLSNHSHSTGGVRGAGRSQG